MSKTIIPDNDYSYTLDRYGFVNIYRISDSKVIAFLQGDDRFDFAKDIGYLGEQDRESVHDFLLDNQDDAFDLSNYDEENND